MEYVPRYESLYKLIMIIFHKEKITTNNKIVNSSLITKIHKQHNLAKFVD